MAEVASNESTQSATELLAEEHTVVNATFPSVYRLIIQMVNQQSIEIDRSNNEAIIDEAKPYGFYRDQGKLRVGSDTDSAIYYQHLGYSDGTEQRLPKYWLPITDSSLLEQDIPDDQIIIKQLIKDGSALFFLVGNEKNPMHGVIINKLNLTTSPEAPFIWKNLVTGSITAPTRFQNVIPVAPILQKTRKNHPEPFRLNISPETLETTIVSRFCGLSYHFIQTKLDELIANNGIKNGLLQSRIITLKNELQSQFMEIGNSFVGAGVIHGHLHLTNMTVEFVRRSALESLSQQGYNINTLPVEYEGQKTIDFNPAVWLEAPDEWTPVVRAIDFDKTTLKQDNPDVLKDIQRHYYAIFPKIPVAKQVDLAETMCLRLLGDIYVDHSAMYKSIIDFLPSGHNVLVDLYKDIIILTVQMRASEDKTTRQRFLNTIQEKLRNLATLVSDDNSEDI